MIRSWRRLQQPKPKRKALVFSAALHCVVLLLLILSVEFQAPLLVVSNDDTKIIDAVALKDMPLIAPPKFLQEKPLPKPQMAPPVQQPIQPPPPAEAEAKATKELEPKVKKQALALAPKKISQKEISKELLADLQDELSKNKKLKQKVSKNKFSQELKHQSEKALQTMMQAEKPASGQRSQHTQGIVDKYKALILEAIGQQWVIPTHVNKTLTCELLIRLAPGGIVLDVQIKKSSGENILDRSARSAVFKASPLPVPDDIYSFEPFKEFLLKVKPENIVDNVRGNQSFWIQ